MPCDSESTIGHRSIVASPCSSEMFHRFTTGIAVSVAKNSSTVSNDSLPVIPDTRRSTDISNRIAPCSVPRDASLEEFHVFGLHVDGRALDRADPKERGSPVIFSQ